MMKWRCVWLHRRLTVLRALSQFADLVRCSCGRLYAINHDVRAVLPWDEVKGFYGAGAATLPLAWYMGDSLRCRRCGALDRDAGQHAACGACEFAGGDLP
jgi:hypothetical protein